MDLIRRRSLLLLGAAPFLLNQPRPATAESWTEFRGPGGQGHSTESELPLRWSESQNVVWKTAIPGLGWSTPVIDDGRIWLTTATGNGASLRLLSLDASTGALLLDREVFHLDSVPSVHEKNSYASPTPILEGDRIYVHFGALGTAAFNIAGDLLWKQQSLRFQHGHGPGGSPAVVGDLLVVNCDGVDQQFVAAINKSDGKIRWKTVRKNGRMAYATPLTIETAGRALVVSPGGDSAGAFDPETGEEVWRVTYDGFSNIPRPVYAHGLVFLATGFYRPALLAVRPDGRGDVTTTHIVWQTARGVPLTPSPIVVGDELYMVSDNGVASCLDAVSGQLHWQQRMDGTFSASPVFADGRIYFQSEDGETTVLQPGKTYRQIAKNRLDGRSLASPAPADGAIFLRTSSHLYRLGKN